MLHTVNLLQLRLIKKLVDKVKENDLKYCLNLNIELNNLNLINLRKKNHNMRCDHETFQISQSLLFFKFKIS